MLQLWFIANTLLWPLKTKLGGLSLGLNVAVLLLAGMLRLGKSSRIAVSTAKVLLFFLAYALFSFFVALTGPCTDLFVKSILTLPILLLLLLVGLEVGRGSSDSDWLNLQKTAWWSLLAAFSAFIVEMLVPAWFPDQARYRADGKFSGLFDEPSHVAFCLFPCIAVLLVAEDKRTRQKGMLALVGLLVVSWSSTLVALTAAWFMYRLIVQGKLRQTAPFALGIALLIALGAAIDSSRIVTPTVERIVGITAASETTNVSSLVYVQGWQDAWFNLMRTHGLGLGLNMMGCRPLPDVSVRSVLALGYGLELNTDDGSFLFSKIVSETGVIGIIFYIVAIWWLVQLAKKLRCLSEGAAHAAVVTQAALIFCFLASSFIRSSGYFGGILLWVVAIGGASQWQRSLPTQPAEL